MAAATTARVALAATLTLWACGCGAAARPSGGAAPPPVAPPDGRAAQAAPRPGAGRRSPPGAAKRHPPARGGHRGAVGIARVPGRDVAAPRAATPAPGRPAGLPSSLLRAFPILRRPATSGDRPAGQARALLLADARAEPPAGRLELARARRLSAAAAPPAWLVPARSRLCLLRAASAAPGGAQALECVRPAAAMRGYLMSIVESPTGTLLQGVLPGGASSARLALAGGRSVPVALREGAYAVRERDATALTYVRGGGLRSVPVPQGPATPATGPAAGGGRSAAP